MKTLTKKQQQRIMLHLVATSKLVHPSNCFNDDLKAWEKWASETVEIVDLVDGWEGLKFMESEVGISSHNIIDY